MLVRPAAALRRVDAGRHGVCGRGAGDQRCSGETPEAGTLDRDGIATRARAWGFVHHGLHQAPQPHLPNRLAALEKNVPMTG
ncbi:hypothetical protein GCM10010236_06520 [Streptomyces eurythermus]|nr:hypothetical protein GCM10010236_06520 [Streptomyces eurythermus]